MIVTAGGWNSFIYNGKFSVKKLYNQLRGVQAKVPWRRVLFITWLAVWNMLVAWKMVTTKTL